MFLIEDRDGAFGSQVEAVLRERDAARPGKDAVRRVVNRLRVGIGDGEIQAAREPLLERRLQGVVIGTARLEAGALGASPSPPLWASPPAEAAREMPD